MSAAVLLAGDELHRRVAQLGGEVAEGCGGGTVMVAVLDGSLVFLADLVRAMASDLTIDFLALSTYGRGSGRVRLVKDLDIDVAGRRVVVVHDVVDTGLTLAWLLRELDRRGPTSLDVCALVDRRARRLVPVPLRWVGVEVGDQFVIGYGLGYEGRYRNLDLLAVGDVDALQADPDAHVHQLYGPRAACGGEPTR